MCEKTKTNVFDSSADRPLRWKSANEIAKKLGAKVGKVLDRFSKALNALMKEVEPPTLKGYTDIDGIEFVDVWKFWLSDTKEKAITLNDIQNLKAQLLTLGITWENISKIDELFSTYSEEFAAAFMEFYPEIYQDGLDEAYNYMNRFARPSDPSLFLAVMENYIIDQNAPLYRNFVAESQSRITSKLSIQFKGATMQIIQNGLTSGLNWQQIVKEVSSKVGMGAKWHWNRLVRTEMQIAYSASFRERYGDAGIQFVTLSVVSTACEICKGKKGTYVFGQEPQIPIHPHCRCTYIPAFSLPRGAQVVGNNPFFTEVPL